MVAKNRKKSEQENFRLLIPFAGLAVLVCVLALGYIWLGYRCKDVAKDLKVLEKEKTELAKKHQNEKRRWARIRSPRNIRKALATHRIAMDWPRPDQIVRVTRLDISGGRAAPMVAANNNTLSDMMRN